MVLRAFLDELVCAWRGLARAPGFAALAVSVLSLGIGATVFMYSVVDAMLLRPPPFPAAERIHVIHGRLAASGLLIDSVSVRDYAAIRESDGPFSAIGAVYSGTVYLTGDGATLRLDGGFATAGLFEVAGVPAALGRVILPGDEASSAPPVAVLGDSLWRERFGADPGVLGRRIRVNGVEAEVVGVMPPGFSFPLRQQLWLPQREAGHAEASPEDAVDVMVFVRLAEGVSADEAQPALADAAARRVAAGTDSSTRSSFEVVSPGESWVGETGRKLLWSLLAAVAVVLLIACANVSNLLLSRAAWRMRETGVRAALGATRGRLVLHVLAESTLLSLSAAAVGLLLAALALDVQHHTMDLLVDAAPPWIEYRIGAPAVAAALAAAFVSTLLAGLPAALRATRPSLDAMLRDGGRGGTGRAVGRLAWSLVAAEVALAAAVLGGAALMTRTVLLVTRADLGVDTAELMTARVGIPVALTERIGAPDEADRRRIQEFVARYVERLEAQPGVEAAALMMALPGHGLKRHGFEVEGTDHAAPEDRPVAGEIRVSPSAFRTLRLEALQGRPLEDTDSGESEPVVVVNQSFAAAHWPGESPLGRRIRFEGTDEPWRTVVGVVPDVLQDVERARMEPVAYLPLAQAPERFLSIVARGDAGPAALAEAMQRALVETDPDLALYWVRTLDESLVQRTSGFRVIGGLFAVFGAIALVLAAAGLYGVLRFHVGQRRREIGLRRALGATDGRVLAMLARTTGAQVALGLAIGLAAVPLIEAALDRIFTELSPGSVFVYVGVVAVMLVVAAAAVARPAWLALRVDPAAALRHE